MSILRQDLPVRVLQRQSDLADAGEHGRGPNPKCNERPMRQSVWLEKAEVLPVCKDEGIRSIP